ncbi:MAG: hypothetical protein AB8C02_00980 [Halioglobus sp.]
MPSDNYKSSTTEHRFILQALTGFSKALARSPATSGFVMAAAGIAVWFFLEKLAERLGAGALNPLIDGVFVFLLLMQAGYFLSVIPLLRRAGLDCVSELKPSLETSDAECEALIQRFSAKKKPIQHWSAIAALVITVVMQESQFARFSLWLSNPDLALGEFWLIGTVWITWTLALSTITLLIVDVAAVQRLGRDYVSVDLMRIEQLSVFSRYGLRLASFVVTLMALWAASAVLFTSFVEISWAEGSLWTGMLLVGIYTALSITVFVLPQLGVRQRIRSEKGRVYSQLTQMLPDGRQALMEADSNPERLAALLSSRNQIQALPEWPAGQHTHIRLAMYLMVPLLSWSAAALVEEAIQRLIN